MVTRKRVVSGCFAAGATALAFASTAYACVTYLGSLQLTPTGAGAVTGNMVTGDGVQTMTYCPGQGPTTAAKQGAAPNNQTVTVAIAPAQGTCASSANQLNGSQQVLLNNTAGFDNVAGSWQIVAGQGCWGSPNNLRPAMAPITGPTATVSETLPSVTQTNGPTDASVFCVGGGLLATGNGIIAPFQVTTL